MGDGYEGGFEIRVGLHAVHLGGFDVLARSRHLGAKLLHQLARGGVPASEPGGTGPRCTLLPSASMAGY